MSSKTATKGCFYVGTKILGPTHPHLSLPLEYTERVFIAGPVSKGRKE